jgi:hypothetical protein
MRRRTLAIVESCHPEKGFQAYVPDLAQPGKPSMHDDPIFAEQRDNVGNRCNRNGLEERFKQSVPARVGKLARGKQRLNEF